MTSVKVTELQGRLFVEKQLKGVQAVKNIGIDIMYHNDNIDYSLILVDPDDRENGLIQVELHLGLETARRPAFLVWKKRYPIDFNYYYSNYRKILSGKLVDACRDHEIR